MVAMLIMCCTLDDKGKSLGWRCWARLIAGIALAIRCDDIVIYTTATRSRGYPDMPCDGAVMQKEAIHSFAPEVPVLALCGEEEWSSRGELRKFFAAVPLGEKLILVSGAYHLDRLRKLVEEHHAEFAPFVEYYEVECDQLSAVGYCVETAKCILAGLPEGFQSGIRWSLEKLRAFRARHTV